ncbi:MAG: hypothetical protein AAFW68_03325 [Pseudomonadota bacterium]
MVGIYPDYIRRLESGDRPLTELWVDAVARALNVPATMVTDPAADIDALARKLPRPKRNYAPLCPVGARYAIVSLVAKLGGLKTAQNLDEDDLADAVQSLMAFIGASDDVGEANDGVDEKSAAIDLNRLSKCLQITVLIILQSRSPDLPADFEQRLERLVPGALSLLEVFSDVDGAERGREN